MPFAVAVHLKAQLVLEVAFTEALHYLTEALLACRLAMTAMRST